MTYQSILLSRAFNELFEAWEWYENRQVGLGDRFRSDVNKKIHEIENHPKRYPNKKANFREAHITSFPYLIIYKISYKQKKIVIVSIFHTSRNPSGKYKAK